MARPKPRARAPKPSKSTAFVAPTEAIRTTFIVAEVRAGVEMTRVHLRPVYEPQSIRFGLATIQGNVANRETFGPGVPEADIVLDLPPAIAARFTPGDAFEVPFLPAVPSC